MGKNITMQDIADKLNISKNSVSQALSGKPGVSEETRKLVKDVADQLGYQYVSKGKTKEGTGANNTVTIGLIASDYAFSLKGFFGQIYLSIEKELRKQGMNLLIESISTHAIKNGIMPTILTNHSINGLLILSHLNTDYTKKLLSTGIPTVLIDHHDPHLQSDAILTNNRFGAFIAVEHLIKLGHKEIGFIGNVNYSPSYEERLEGFLLALSKYNIEPVDDFLYTNAKETEEATDSFLFNLKRQPTAWFCVNDGHGFLTTSVLQQKGYQIPRDISVANFDNGQLSQIANPKITTMDIDLNYFGKKAVEQILWRMDHKNDPIQEILLSPKLIIRQSTGHVKESFKTT